MKLHLYFFITFIFFNFLSYGQTEDRKTCGTTKAMEEALQDPEKQQILNQLEIFTQEYISDIDNNRLGGPYIIPLVVHVVHLVTSSQVSLITLTT